MFELTNCHGDLGIMTLLVLPLNASPMLKKHLTCTCWCNLTGDISLYFTLAYDKKV
jgi:hypothetical protein